MGRVHQLAGLLFGVRDDLTVQMVLDNGPVFHLIIKSKAEISTVNVAIYWSDCTIVGPDMSIPHS